MMQKTCILWTKLPLNTLKFEIYSKFYNYVLHCSMLMNMLQTPCLQYKGAFSQLQNYA